MTKNKKYYCQCEIRKQTSEGCKIDVAWIPEKYAKIGKYVKIKFSGQWEDGWQVTSVWSKREASKIEASERDYTKQRKVSDV